MPTAINHVPAFSTLSSAGAEPEAVLAKFRPRTLFGLPANAPTMKAAYPLCDRFGAPACGNVGQPGRHDAPVAAPAHSEIKGN
jgi:hypothetical protein